MNAPDERILKAILSLNNDNNFNIFMSWISDNLEELKNNLIDCPKERISGMAHGLKCICVVAKDSKKLLTMIEENQSRIASHRH